MATNSRKSALQALCKEFTCPLCSDLYKDPLLFTGCGHAFCSNCIYERLEGPGVTKSECPSCHQPAWRKDLVPNRQYGNIANILRAWPVIGEDYTQEPADAPGQGRAGKEQDEWAHSDSRIRREHTPGPQAVGQIQGKSSKPADSRKLKYQSEGSKQPDLRSKSSGKEPRDNVDITGAALGSHQPKRALAHGKAKQRESESLISSLQNNTAFQEKPVKQPTRSLQKGGHQGKIDEEGAGPGATAAASTPAAHSLQKEMSLSSNQQNLRPPEPNEQDKQNAEQTRREGQSTGMRKCISDVQKKGLPVARKRSRLSKMKGATAEPEYGRALLATSELPAGSPSVGIEQAKHDSDRKWAQNFTAEVQQAAEPTQQYEAAHATEGDNPNACLTTASETIPETPVQSGQEDGSAPLEHERANSTLISPEAQRPPLGLADQLTGRQQSSQGLEVQPSRTSGASLDERFGLDWLAQELRICREEAPNVQQGPALAQEVADLMACIADADRLLERSTAQQAKPGGLFDSPLPDSEEADDLAAATGQRVSMVDAALRQQGFRFSAMTMSAEV